jgi:hypothetical protein
LGSSLADRRDLTAEVVKILQMTRESLHTFQSMDSVLGNTYPPARDKERSPLFLAVFRIRIHWVHMFLGFPDPDPLVRGMDPDPVPSIIKLKK